MPARFVTQPVLSVLMICTFVVVVSISVLLQVSWALTGCLVLLGVLACLVGLERRAHRWQAYLAWIATIVVAALAVGGEFPLLEYGGFFLALAGGIAALLWLAAARLPRTDLRMHWQLLGASWTVFALLYWLEVAYLLNLKVEFYLGLLAAFGFLIALKRIRSMPGALVLTVNTMLLLIVGLPLADLLTRPNYQLPERPDLRQRLYAYEEARKDPGAFARWWYYFVREWRVTQKDICMATTNSPAPFRLRPGSDGKMFESAIHINRLGFRGPEIPVEKGPAYRIVTLGESTTFGHTMYADDVPWPRLLERMITNEFGLSRPAQVINAGIPSYDLHLNIERLHRRILNLKADMIISYHGYNGFNWLLPELPPVSAQPPPPYEERPIKLLADVEYRFKVIAYRRNLTQAANIRSRTRSSDDNAYEQGYRELIEIARTNHIQLVLANYSMAVNAKSDLDVVAFYRAGFPQVISQIKANELHSQLVARLAAENPDVCFVDTHPALDGRHENFIDLVHFTQPGRERMAQTMFNAIRPLLAKDLAKSGDGRGNDPENSSRDG